MHWLKGIGLALIGWLATGVQGAENNDAEALWSVLRSGGHIALMRHALAPGTGDPAHFKLEDCATQRNLSEEGREQARRTGNLFRERDVRVGRVLSSQWCRCLETAELLNPATVEPFPALNSFFREREHGTGQTAELRRFVSAPFEGPSRVLVTHQVNITALTDVFPQSGEIVVLQPRGDAGFALLGRIPTL
jgi:phosphohistidine phosphatase SixA